jgi:F0F1-type ATP synthase membrane subunit c/vacuolar-type H+-ATPase subunit K
MEHLVLTNYYAGLALLVPGLGTGLVVLAAAFGIGKIGGAAMEAIARQPEAGGQGAACHDYRCSFNRRCFLVWCGGMFDDRHKNHILKHRKGWPMTLGLVMPFCRMTSNIVENIIKT